MSAGLVPPLIYNLFPRHFANIDQWGEGLKRAKQMGFNWVFVNPFHETGFSGSLYAVKDYYRLNPLFLPPGSDPSDWSPLDRFVDACRDAGIGVMMDLVINHTAFDSVLVDEHPKWYKRDKKGKIVSPFAVDPDDASNITVWGDLATINNLRSREKEALWTYWDDLVAFFQDKGIEGFRCDAAYQVPAALWKRLIKNAKKRCSDALFAAETLGCTSEETQALKGTGFDYLFNSSKYWNFDKPWCLEQHELFQKVAPSIAFPESHDTPRLASEAPGTLAMQKNRYVLAAIFSEGLLMPMGYEFGARTAMHVVEGSPSDVDDPQWNLLSWIGEVNELKRSTEAFRCEGHWTNLSSYDSDILFLKKSGGGETALVLVNKDWHQERQVHTSEFPGFTKPLTKINRPFESPTTWSEIPETFVLEPSEIVILR